MIVTSRDLWRHSNRQKWRSKVIWWVIAAVADSIWNKNCFFCSKKMSLLQDNLWIQVPFWRVKNKMTDFEIDNWQLLFVISIEKKTFQFHFFSLPNVLFIASNEDRQWTNSFSDWLTNHLKTPVHLARNGRKLRFWKECNRKRKSNCVSFILWFFLPIFSHFPFKLRAFSLGRTMFAFCFLPRNDDTVQIMEILASPTPSRTKPQSTPSPSPSNSMLCSTSLTPWFTSVQYRFQFKIKLQYLWNKQCYKRKTWRFSKIHFQISISKTSNWMFVDFTFQNFKLNVCRFQSSWDHKDGFIFHTAL